MLIFFWGYSKNELYPMISSWLVNLFIEISFIPKKSVQKCQQFDPLITPDLFCTLPREPAWRRHHKACLGDSGGPCAFKNKGSFELSGIISLDQGCKRNQVGFHADVLGKDTGGKFFYDGWVWSRIGHYRGEDHISQPKVKIVIYQYIQRLSG